MQHTSVLKYHLFIKCVPRSLLTLNGVPNLGTIFSKIKQAVVYASAFSVALTTSYRVVESKATIVCLCTFTCLTLT